MSETDIDKVINRVKKLYALAEKAGTPAEAAAATAMAQEILEKYNLSMAQVAGKVSNVVRDKKQSQVSHYKHVQKLWEYVSYLNFCRHRIISRWEQVTKRSKHNADLTYSTERLIKYNIIVGRKENILATEIMIEYLLEAVERLTRQHYNKGGTSSSGFFSAASYSFRLGAADDICSRLYDRRSKMLSDEQKAHLKGMEGLTSREGLGTALVMTHFISAEEDANIDADHGEGTAARWAADRAKRAAQKREEDAAYTQWAAANPALAAKKEAEAEKAAEKLNKRQNKGNTVSDYRAYWDGRDAAASISLDTQVSGNSNSGLLT